jgi:aspartyl-tRNA(Asn)/glutamyl-tRNA(Gln) amidotransferase subunit A
VIDGQTLDTRLVTTRFARGFNALGFPALVMPCGESPEGMPIGLQMVGRPFEEGLLFKLGEALE